MLYAIIKRPDEEERGYLFTDTKDYITETFNPETEIIDTIDFTIHGKTYAERKTNLETIAIEWSNHGDTTNISWLDCMILGDYFTRNGKRYGLLRDFTENGLC